MYNKVVMVGNLTRDIELRYLPSGAAIAKSAIATSHKYKTQSGEQKDEVCFLDFNIFGRSAEVANQYLRKGSKVLLEGRLVLEQWTAQDGSNRSKHSLRVDTMKMLDSKADSMGGQQGGYQQQPQQGGYDAPSNDNYGANNMNNYNQGGMNNQAPQVQDQKIPEIDIDEDEIPF
jgi:single-strand DNA-binding protein